MHQPIAQTIVQTIVQYPTRAQESQQEVIDALLTLSRKLQALLPDPSLSPLERIERLARVIPHSIQSSAEHLTARTKLTRMRIRLATLIPEPLTDDERIDRLLAKVHALVPEPTARLFEKLEKIGDRRLTDTGAVPYPNWNEEHLLWPHLMPRLPKDTAEEEEGIEGNDDEGKKDPWR